MRSAAILLLLVLVAGCGGRADRSPEAVARAWSKALDANDNDRAATLFADGAKVLQEGVLTLPDHASARRWNALLPCGGRIESVQSQGRDQVLVVFVLTDRPGHACDGPGDGAAAVFQVEHGRIVLWHEVPVPSNNAI